MSNTHPLAERAKRKSPAELLDMVDAMDRPPGVLTQEQVIFFGGIAEALQDALPWLVDVDDLADRMDLRAVVIDGHVDDYLHGTDHEMPGMQQRGPSDTQLAMAFQFRARASGVHEASTMARNSGAALRKARVARESARA